jgi:hypothetical protein
VGDGRRLGRTRPERNAGCHLVPDFHCSE